MGDVCSEVNDLFKKKFGSQQFTHCTKPVNRKYAFELPDIPAEAQYLKVTYPFKSKFFHDIKS
jgi:DNA polymerase alpha subunit A